MTFKEYDKSVQRTMEQKQVVAEFATEDKSGPFWVDVPNVVYLSMGLTGEAGEATDLLKKSFFHGAPLDAEKLKKELGDVLYYISALGYEFGWSLEEIAEGNNAKLQARYPNGFVLGGGIREGEGA